MAETVSDKERLAERVRAAWGDFNACLHRGGRYPHPQFQVFFDAVVAYAKEADEDGMIHRNIASLVCGLREMLGLERKHVPDEIIGEADRLECILLGGYDPWFEGDEPPGL